MRTWPQFLIAIIFTYLIFVEVLGCYPTQIQGVDAVPLPRQTCVSDENCPLNYFCNTGAPVSKKICSPCLRCSLIKRHPGKDSCAKYSSDCGNCFSGFHDIGDHEFTCAEDDKTTTASTTTTTVAVAGVSDSTTMAGQDTISPKKVFLIVVFTAFVLAGVVGFLLLGNKLFKKWKESRALRLADGKDSFALLQESPVRPSEGYGAPSAPPNYNFEEYARQRPYNVVQERLAQALPNNRGNGAGHWRIEENKIQELQPVQPHGHEGVVDQESGSSVSSSSSDVAEAQVVPILPGDVPIHPANLAFEEPLPMVGDFLDDVDEIEADMDDEDLDGSVRSHSPSPSSASQEGQPIFEPYEDDYNNWGSPFDFYIELDVNLGVYARSLNPSYQEALQQNPELEMVQFNLLGNSNLSIPDSGTGTGSSIHSPERSRFPSQTQSMDLSSQEQSLAPLVNIRSEEIVNNRSDDIVMMDIEL